MNVLQAQKAGTIKSNLKGVALGDAWVSPIDSVLTWAPFLLSTVNDLIIHRRCSIYTRSHYIYRQNKYFLQQIKKSNCDKWYHRKREKHAQRTSGYNFLPCSSIGANYCLARNFSSYLHKELLQNSLDIIASQGMVDTESFKEIDAAAQITKSKVKLGKWTQATAAWSNTQGVVLEKTYNVDFYNILTKRNLDSYHSSTKNASFLSRGIQANNIITLFYKDNIITLNNEIFIPFLILT